MNLRQARRSYLVRICFYPEYIPRLYDWHNNPQRYVTIGVTKSYAVFRVKGDEFLYSVWNEEVHTAFKWVLTWNDEVVRKEIPVEQSVEGAWAYIGKEMGVVDPEFALSSLHSSILHVKECL